MADNARHNQRGQHAEIATTAISSVSEKAVDGLRQSSVSQDQWLCILTVIASAACHLIYLIVLTMSNIGR